jgi:hypothetical protein
VKIYEVAFAAGDPLERHKVRERADRCLHPIDSACLGARAKLGKAEWWRRLCEQVKLAMGRG